MTISEAVDRLAQPRPILRATGAIMLVAQGLVHLRLWSNGYRNIDVIGPLFLVGVISAFVLALAVAVRPSRPVVVAGILVSLGQVGALAVSRVTGLFGFMTSGGLSPSEWSAVGAELLAAAALGALVAVRLIGGNDAAMPTASR